MSNEPTIEQQVERAVGVLHRGGIVAFPTDTVYGLGADPLNEKAVDSIYRVKMRSRRLPLPLLLASKEDLLKVAVDIPEIAWMLAERFWPGGLTLVLKKSPWVPGAVVAGSDTIAVRIPDHHIAVTLIYKLGNPLVGTSANISGKPSPVTASQVYEQLKEKVDLVIDGGECPGGIESTVIDVCGEIPAVLREGAVSWKALSKVCGALLRETKSE